MTDTRTDALPVWIVIILALALLVLGAGGAWYYNSQAKAARQAAIAHLTEIGQGQAAAIAAWRRNQLEQAAAVMEIPFLAQEVIRFLTDPRDMNAHLLRTRFASLPSRYQYTEVLVLDQEGRNKLGRTWNAETSSIHASALKEALHQGTPVFARMHMDDRQEKPCISIVVPVFGQSPDAVLPDFQPLGGLVLIQEAEQGLYPLLRSWPASAETGETLLVRRDKDAVVFLNNLAMYANTALKLQVSVAKKDTLVIMAALGRQGVVQGKDYRGVDVVAVLLPVPDSPWYMVAKQDADRVFAQWQVRSGFLLTLFAAMAGGLVVIGLLVWQEHKMAKYKRLYRAEARLRREAKQAGAALQESERSKSVLMANLPGMVYRCCYDRDWTMQFLSQGCSALTGYRPDDLKNNSRVSFNDLILPEDRRHVYDIWDRAVAEHIPAKLEYRIITAEKQQKWVYEQGVPVYDKTGSVQALEGIIMDISDRKKAEAEREKLDAQFQQAQKMESVGRLAGGVAHDYNNMLNVILGYAELALGKIDPSDPLHDNLEKIHSAAVRSADITRQLLAFARKQTISPQVLDVNRTIDGGMLQILHRLMGENIDLSWQPADNLWPVKMDPMQIDQILANLCVNARDAIADVGKITIETGTKTFDQAYCDEHPGFMPGDFVMLAVSDNGCGMDKETQENMFEPFFTTKKAGKGTGLGLATVYGIVKQNNGFINVYSEEDKGTTIRIYLARHTESQAQAPPEKKTRMPSGHGETVLVVEDETVILDLACAMLAHLGYTALAAASPEDALKKAQAHAGRIHLVITDVVMPGMNGRDLAQQLTQLYPDLKVLFMSGYTANVIAHHGVLDQGVHFMQKPFSMDDIAAKVREVMG
ncbi:MAG: ATP-binding protein, partial [Desulfotignum sp.]|nr:ATP-binding protein [Desulfotignum sp.]